MQQPRQDTDTQVHAPEPARLRWQKLVVWLLGCGVVGVLMAWAAVVARGYFAPLLLFPLVVGVVLGGVLVLAMRVSEVGHRPTLWLGALLAALLTVAGEHYLTFWRARQLVAREPGRFAKLQLVAPERVPPAGFWQFIEWSAARGLPIDGSTARDGWVWLVWSIDGLLVLAPALALVAVTARMPYCDRCQHWYHTTRSGKIDAQAALRLADLAAIALGPEVERARYRLLVCEGGCGPAGLVLFWEDAKGRYFSETRWIDAARFNQVTAILDQSNLQ